MKVTVEGTVISIEQKEKDGKKFTNLVLHQQGNETLTVRMPGHVADQYDLYQVIEVTGRLNVWTQNNRVYVSLFAG